MQALYDLSIPFIFSASRKLITLAFCLSLSSLLLKAQETKPPLLLECVFKDSSVQRFYKNDPVWIKFLDGRKSPIHKAQMQKPFKLNAIDTNQISLTSEEGYQYTLPLKEFKGIGKIDPIQLANPKKNKLSGLGISGIILSILGGIVLLGASAENGNNNGSVSDSISAGCFTIMAIPIFIVGLVLLVVGLKNKPTVQYNHTESKMILFKHPDCNCKTFSQP